MCFPFDSLSNHPIQGTLVCDSKAHFPSGLAKSGLLICHQNGPNPKHIEPRNSENQIKGKPHTHTLMDRF